jgi:hypothetical protein
LLGLRGLSSFFLLDWRIFSYLSVTLIVVASPSGFVPNGSRDGRVKRSWIIVDDV